MTDTNETPVEGNERPEVTNERPEATDGDTRKEEQEAATTDQNSPDSRLKQAAEKLKSATGAYRELLASANPDIPAELIKGESIEELKSSLEEAKKLVARLKAGLKEEARASRVPAGAPARSEPDTSALSPVEKIRYGINKGGK